MHFQPSDAAVFEYIATALRNPGKDCEAERTPKGEAIWAKAIDVLDDICCPQFRVGANGKTKIHFIRFEP